MELKIQKIPNISRIRSFLVLYFGILAFSLLLIIADIIDPSPNLEQVNAIYFFAYGIYTMACVILFIILNEYSAKDRMIFIYKLVYLSIYIVCIIFLALFFTILFDTIKQQEVIFRYPLYSILIYLGLTGFPFLMASFKFTKF